jgi:DNA-binding NarL/FixJ family response regulator
MMGSFSQRAEPARVLIADQAELFRRGLRDALTGDGAFAVAGEVQSLDGVPDAYLRIRPDVALIAGETLDGFVGALGRILSADPVARVIVLVPPAANGSVTALVRAGAQGVLLRDAPIAAVRSALADVCAGGSALDSRLAATLFASLASNGSMSPDGALLDPRVLTLLSRREREVLRALALGYRNKQIGAELGVSVGTVKTHLRHIFRKLQVSDRTGAVLKAMDAGLKKAA